MKKLIFLTLLSCGPLSALPIGSPSEASLTPAGMVFPGLGDNRCDPCLDWCNGISFRFGFYGDYVFNRHLEIDQNNFDDKIDQASLFTNAGYVALNVWDGLDFFATFGTSTFTVEGNTQAFGKLGNGRLRIEMSPEFSWSFGVRATIWEWGCTSAGVEGQYFCTKPHVRQVTENCETSIYPNSWVRCLYEEWQVGVGISHKINQFVPYLGVKCSHARIDFGDAELDFGIWKPAVLYDLESGKDWGFAVGLTYLSCGWGTVTVEGRFADEKAVYVNGQLRF